MKGDEKISPDQEEGQTGNSWNKIAFWNLLLVPFFIVLLSEPLVEIFIGFLPEALVEYSYFCFLIMFFALSIGFFHKCAFKYGPRVFGERAVGRAINFIDYIWYAFGGIALSYFATGEFQDRYLQETAEDRMHIADVNQTLLDGAFFILYPACREFKASGREDASFGQTYQNFTDFCDNRVATRDLSEGFDVECRAALASMDGMSREELVSFRILRPVRGRELNDLEFLCVNAKRYEELVEEYRGAGEKIGDWIGGVPPRSFWTYVLLAALVALKFIKVTAGIRKSG